MRNQKAPEVDWQLLLLNRLVEAQPVPSGFGERLIQIANGLFHYTTAIGLKGIIEDKCLWATAASYLNDASEIDYGCTILDEVLAKRERSNSGSMSLSTVVVQALRAIFSDPNTRLERATAIYVACFCTRNNLLSQWRTYGQVSGYSIGFWLFGNGLPARDQEKLGGLKPETNTYRSTLVQVIYERDQQLATLEDALRRNMEVLDGPGMKEIYESLDIKAKQQFMATAVLWIEHFLMEQIVALKNKAFEEEKEWRIVVRKISRKGALVEGEKDAAVYLRSARGLIIPYVKLVPTSGFLPIRSVTIGPSLNKARAERSLKLLLVQNDLTPSINIDGSDIPVVM